MPQTSVRDLQKVLVRRRSEGVRESVISTSQAKGICRPLKYCLFSHSDETVKFSSYQLRSCSTRSFHQILLSNLQHKQQLRISSPKTSTKTSAKLVLEPFPKHTASPQGSSFGLCCLQQCWIPCRGTKNINWEQKLLSDKVPHILDLSFPYRHTFTLYLSYRKELRSESLLVACYFE